jgi:hypothetical protein
MTQAAWNDLVARLSDSGKQKEAHLLQAQHKQLKDQLEGLTFTPQISEKSRELAGKYPALSERVAALMRKKKAKLDRIRNEKAEKELAEATFRPNINKPKTPVDGTVRKLGHLMQYEIHRRMRAEQRRAIQLDIEDRELKFQPTINKNSARIVARLKAEADAEAVGLASPSTTARVHKKNLIETLAGQKPLGRSYLPGHEQETFHPTINPRSRALHRPGIDDLDVYTRLYEQGAGSKSPRSGSASVDGSAEEPVRGGQGSSVVGAGAGPAGDPEAPGGARFFNAIAYDAAGKHDFILRRLLSGHTYE